MTMMGVDISRVSTPILFKVEEIGIGDPVCWECEGETLRGWVRYFSCDYVFAYIDRGWRFSMKRVLVKELRGADDS